MNVGAVGALRNVKNAVSVARHVLERTEHSLLVGSQATKFAVQMGFSFESLSTRTSKNIWKKWKTEDNCQPNFWMVRVRGLCLSFFLLRTVTRSPPPNHSLKIYGHSTLGTLPLSETQL